MVRRMHMMIRLSSILASACFQVTLLSPLMNMERPFSEIFPSGNLLIALEPMGLSKFRKKYGITYIHRDRQTYLKKLFVFKTFKSFYWLQKNFIFHSANLKILIKLFYHLYYMFTDTHEKFEVESLASFSAMKSYSSTNTRNTGQ